MSQAGFWRELRQDNRDLSISSNRLGKISNVFYLFPQGNGPRGSFTDFTTLKANLRSRDIIILGGVLREQAVAPDDVYDVTVLGAANMPRQATSGGSPTGGGACWLPPSSGAVAATPLLELRAQGWAFENIEFTPHTSSAALRLTRSASVDTIDAGHVRVTNCFFAANGGTGQIGIEDNGGCRSALIEGCRFESLASAILSLNTAAAICQDWVIQDNNFRLNTNDVKMSLNYSRILRNRFMTAGSGATNKVISTTFISTQGGNNFVIDNQFNNTEAQIAPGSGFTGAASDVWRNFVTDGTWYAIGQPA